ncbi:helix-turn-helix domain containing protein [Microbacterium betulae]|uniref:Helix-turn-helix domain containing protein n=1 Tax=Microbacterium betulae TaxID=2981139 RepID=A0AA97I6J6_9MICO|nr:helix-turn-helix domain-containing protein [Microbacterium sp. AB]WOF23924.1 helix-turn-helix domain containing protein [Microbacterium sp. AB]
MEVDRVGSASRAGAAGPGRRLRADAQRNVAALLDAAKVVFASDGVDVPAKQITDSAGVGVGTLYRHFPRRSDLIIAVLRQEIDACIAAAGELGRSHEAWEALVLWIERFADFVATKQGLAAALHSDDPAYDGLPEQLLDRLEPALDALLSRAVRERRARAGVGPREIMVSIALLSQSVAGEPPEFNRRMIGVYLDGLTVSRGEA